MSERARTGGGVSWRLASRRGLRRRIRALLADVDRSQHDLGMLKPAARLEVEAGDREESTRRSWCRPSRRGMKGEVAR